MAQILLIDDSDEIQRAVFAVLGTEHQIEWAPSLQIAKAMLGGGKRFDLLLLDVNLPDGNGFDYLKEQLAQFKNAGMRTIFLTGTSTSQTRKQGYTLGALDYIAKPFDLEEFAIRVNVKLQELAHVTPVTHLRVGNIEFDLEKSLAFAIAPQRAVFDLTPVEFRLALLLLRHHGKVVKREDILANVWGEGVHISKRCVDHHICGLRKKLADHQIRLESAYGVGYQAVSSQTQNPAQADKPTSQAA